MLAQFERMGKLHPSQEYPRHRAVGRECVVFEKQPPFRRRSGFCAAISRRFLGMKCFYGNASHNIRFFATITILLTYVVRGSEIGIG